MAVAVTGCGGGSSEPAANSVAADSSGPVASSDAAAVSITKAGLIRRGDAICSETDKIQNADLEAFIAKHPHIPTNQASQEIEVKTAGLPPIKTEIRELAELGIPKGDQQQVSAIITGFEHALKAVEAKPSLVIGADHSPFDRPNRLAARYGFKACSNAL